MGAWQPGLDDEVGPVSEKGQGGVGGGCVGRGKNWGCRPVPGCLGQGSGWTRLGLGVLGKEYGQGSASKADAEFPLV